MLLKSAKSNLAPRPAYLTDKRGLGGGETSLLNHLSALAGSGVRPVLLCPRGELYCEAARLDIDLHPVDYPDVHLKMSLIPTFSVITVLRIARLMRKYLVNVVHAESLLGLYYGGIAAKLCGTPLVATYHGYWPLDVKLNRSFLRWFCRRVYPVSSSMETELLSVFDSERGRILTIPLGVASAFLEPLPSGTDSRVLLGLPLDRQIVLQVARFQSIKGHHHLLNALSLLKNKMGEKAPLVVFIGGVMEPPLREEIEYREYIENLSARPDLQKHVCFLGQRKDVPLVMRAADLVVCPSDFESFSMAVIESMAVGTPVVATDAGGPGEIIEHNKSGFLVQPGNPGALAAGIIQMLDNPDHAAKMASAAKEIVKARYAPEHRCNILLNEYRELIV